MRRALIPCLLLALLSVVALSLLVAAPAAADRYVSPTGVSTGSCLTSGTACTFAQADAVVQPGETVHVADGNYAYSPTTLQSNTVVIHTNTSGTSGSPITWLADHKWGPKLNGATYQWTWANTANWVVIDGFDISGANSVGLLNYADHVRIRNNRAHDNIGCDTSNGGAGIDQYGIDHGGGFRTSTDNWITNNIVYNNYDNCGSPSSDPGHHGIYFAYGDGFVINNIVYGNGTPSSRRGYGIHLWHAPVNVKIYNNLSFHNASAGIIVGNANTSGEQQTTGIVVANNIFYDNGLPGGSRFQARVFGNVAKGNIVWQDNLWNVGPNGAGGQDFQISVVESGTVTGDPAFVNYQADGSGNYHLTSGSPARDAGVTHTEASPDFDGLTRPQHTAYCIGPYESPVTGNSTLTVSKTGTGTGTVTSAPSGIMRGGTSAANFTTGSNRSSSPRSATPVSRVIGYGSRCSAGLSHSWQMADPTSSHCGPRTVG